MSEFENGRMDMDQRRQQVSDLYLRGWNQIAIAEKLHVSQSTISHDLRAIKNEWRAPGMRNLDAMSERELQKLDLVEREAWAAWERSANAAARSEKTGETKTRAKSQNPFGDPRFLDQVRKCVAQRRRILDQNAPSQAAEGRPLIDDPSEQRRARIEEIFQDLPQEANLGTVSCAREGEAPAEPR